VNRQEATIIDSASYGKLQVTADHIFQFPRGILGLPDIREYALIEVENAPYSVLHAINEQVSFILIPAQLAVQDYGFAIDQSTVELLKVKEAEEVLTYLIVNIIDDQIFVNLKAPVLLAENNRNGCQYIIDNAQYSLRHPLSPREGE